VNKSNICFYDHQGRIALLSKWANWDIPDLCTLQKLIVKTLHAQVSDSFITWELLYKQYLTLVLVTVNLTSMW